MTDGDMVRTWWTAIVGHLTDGVTESVLQRAFDYWQNVDEDLGDRIERGARTG